MGCSLVAALACALAARAPAVRVGAEFGNAPRANANGSSAALDGAQWTALIVASIGHLDTTLNWLHHFSTLGLGIPVVLVAEDEAIAGQERGAFKNYSGRLNMTVARAGSGANATWEQHFGSPGYNKIVSRRGYHILNLLKQGRNVIYSDVDSVWLKDPRLYLEADPSGSPRALWVAPDGPSRQMCTGFLAVKNTPETQKLMLMWGDALLGGERRNQPTFNYILKNRWREHGVCNPGILDEQLFPAGAQYFRDPSWNRAAAAVVHASYIKGGFRKQKAFEKFGLWRPF